MNDYNAVPANLPPTRILWSEQPYCASCTANVIYCNANQLVTNATIFYAESGGQVPDRGYIDGVPVIDVQKIAGKPLFNNSNDNEQQPIFTETITVHTLSQNIMYDVGQQVRMSIDWDYRYKLMRYHSAAHCVIHAIDIILDPLLSRLIRGCYIYDRSSRIDYSSKLDPSRIDLIQKKANEIIDSNSMISMYSDPLEPGISYWKCLDIKIMCGGTHVANTSEIGKVSLRRRSQGKNLDRIYLSLD